jgi:ribosomal-protein-alanine N-acetyltransferase
MTLPQVQLRAARASDLDAIVALERATEHAPHWPPAAYAANLDSTAPQRCLIVAETDAEIAGFAAGLMHPALQDSPQRVAELESVVVAASARRAGIGRAVCNAVIEWCRTHGATEMVLEVRATSTGAIALYTGLGFTQTGRRPRYYRDPEDDAVVMRLEPA